MIPPWERPAAQENAMLIENKYFVAAAVALFLLALLLTGSLWTGFGVLALIAGVGWAVRRFSSHS
jgi:hypothetical protein